MKITAMLIYTPECKEDCEAIRKKKGKCYSCMYDFQYNINCKYYEWFVDDKQANL